MKTVLELISKAPAWVSPDHVAETAVVLMRGYGVSALPVVEAGHVAGVLTSTDLLGVGAEQPVGMVMTRDLPTVPGTATVREAADAVCRSGGDRLAVVDQDKLVGMVGCRDLLPEVGRSYDPLTGLPWTDSLHEWAISHFKRGLELTVLFLDLDDFGRFNKVYGHVVGDEVLRTVAHTVASIVEEHTDYLCRYGGDEFCIASLRTAQEAANLGSRIVRQIQDIEIPAAGGKHISCSVGQAGGMRSREREHVHFAATVNNLINLASRDCTRHKPSARAGAAAPLPAATPARLHLGRVDITEEGETLTARVSVYLEPTGPSIPDPSAAGAGTRLAALASAQAERGTTDVPRLVAEATVTALRALAPGARDFSLLGVTSHRVATGDDVLVVVGDLTVADEKRRVAGSAISTNGNDHAPAQAVLSAISGDIDLLLSPVRAAP